MNNPGIKSLWVFLITLLCGPILVLFLKDIITHCQ